MSNLLVTCTRGRPKAFDLLAKIVKKQTTQDFDWLVICDEWAGYKFPKECKIIKRDGTDDTLPSLNENWRAALDWVAKHESYGKILVIEDDDWYHREYVLETATLLDRCDLFGWQEDAYYYCLSRKARRCHNVGFAALGATAFNRTVLPYLRKCVELGTPHIDVALWRGIREKAVMAQPPMTMSGGVTVAPPAVEYARIKEEFAGKKLLAHNFTGLAEEGTTIRWDDQGKLIVVSNEPHLDNHGNIAGEHPRHVGMKEPWHGGVPGASSYGHDPRSAGGPDIFGDTLRKWLGNEDAKLYLQFTKDPPRNPYPPMLMVPMPIDSV